MNVSKKVGDFLPHTHPRWSPEAPSLWVPPLSAPADYSGESSRHSLLLGLLNGSPIFIINFTIKVR